MRPNPYCNLLLVSAAIIAILMGQRSLATSLAQDPQSWQLNWSHVLEQVVDSAGRIDFAKLRQDPVSLDELVDFVAMVDPSTRLQLYPDRHAKMAYYLNTYNILAMHGVLRANVPDSLGGIRKLFFFYLQKFSVGGRDISLYALENDVIRPMGDERVHFALNCMVKGCPKLPRVAFSADIIDAQLDSAARTFINDERNVRPDAAAKEVWLSAIFRFYTADFLAHAPSLIAYINRYRLQPLPTSFAVRFLDYDWKVNSSPR